MTPEPHEAQARREEIQAVLQKHTTRSEELANAFLELGHAEDSVHRQTVSAALIDYLKALARLQDLSQDAVRAMAVELVERGISGEIIARAAGVSRVTVHNWVKNR